MHSRLSARLALLAFVCMDARAGYGQSVQAQERVLVRTFKSRTSIRIQGFGLRVNYQAAVSVLPVHRNLQFVKEKSGWRVSEIGSSREATFYNDSVLRVSGEMLRAEGLSAANDLILRSKGSQFEVIADVEMDDYLRGVLPSEMPPQWPMEAFKAQAVAARTYVMNVMRQQQRNGDFKRLGYFVDNTTQHQVFQMQNFTGASMKIREKIDTAIAATRGIFLVDSSRDPYRTYFHSDCGGATEEPDLVWHNGVRSGTVTDERCKLNPLSAWSYSISRSQLSDKLRGYFSLVKDAQLESVKAELRTPSGRIDRLSFQFTSETTPNAIVRNLEAQEFRRLYGYNSVKSTNFSFVMTDSTLELKGRGHGHGAGMCQKGARFMALAGAKYAEILRRYYPQAMLYRELDLANNTPEPTERQKVSQNETLHR